MKITISFIISVVIILSLPTYCFAAEQAADAEGVPQVKAKSSILMCMNTGDVIYENNSYEHLSPASVTKIMSILLIAEALDSGKISLKDMVTAGENAVSKGGSQIWLELGEKMSVDDLFKAVIVASANDACTALGEYIAGSDIGFVKMMNTRAKEMGLKNTRFENCTGLDDEIKNHYSCAHDLAVIAGEVMKHDIVHEYSSIWLDSLRGGKTELNNTNKLIKSYKGITGLKTGTTSLAGFCLCATASRDGMDLVSVVLGSDTSKDRFDGAAALLDYGFANYSTVKPKLDKSLITPVAVKNGAIKEITPVFTQSNEILVKKGFEDFKYEYKCKSEVAAPVKKGDILGSVIVTSGENKIASVNLTAPSDVAKISFSYIFNKILHMI